MFEKEYLITFKAEQLAKQYKIKKADFPSATSWAYQMKHQLTMGVGKNWRIVAVKEK